MGFFNRFAFKITALTLAALVAGAVFAVAFESSLLSGGPAYAAEKQCVKERRKVRRLCSKSANAPAKCGSANDKLNGCLQDGAEINFCTNEYDPVCAITEDGEATETFSNRCFALAARAEPVFSGACRS